MREHMETHLAAAVSLSLKILGLVTVIVITTDTYREMQVVRCAQGLRWLMLWPIFTAASRGSTDIAPILQMRSRRSEGATCQGHAGRKGRAGIQTGQPELRARPVNPCYSRLLKSAGGERSINAVLPEISMTGSPRAPPSQSEALPEISTRGGCFSWFLCFSSPSLSELTQRG